MTTLYEINTRNRRRKADKSWFYELNTGAGREGMERFWVCWVEGSDGGRQYKHYSLADAEVETERLAQLYDVHGKAVYLFECKGKCRIKPLQLEWQIPRN